MKKALVIVGVVLLILVGVSLTGKAQSVDVPKIGKVDITVDASASMHTVTHGLRTDLYVNAAKDLPLGAKVTVFSDVQTLKDSVATLRFGWKAGWSGFDDRLWLGVGFDPDERHYVKLKVVIVD